MIKNFTPAKPRTIVEHSVEFEYDELGSGFTFPCKPGGEVNVVDLPPEAQENYRDCMAHPERFAIWNQYKRRERQYMEPATGDCVCGEHVVLESQYLGCCQCSKCGRWYNIYGQSMLPPDQWAEDY